MTGETYVGTGISSRLDVMRDDLAVLAQSLCDLSGTVLQLNVVLDLLDRECVALLDGGRNDCAGQGESRREVCEGRHVR